jgi:transcriptional regulator with XRE-family HTH domain
VGVGDATDKPWVRRQLDAWCVDDRTSGLVIRALRRRRGWRQSDLATRAGVSQSTVSRAERGWFDDLSLRMIRALFAALEARVQLAPRWKGAELERLIDEDHSVVVADLARRLEALGWLVEIEVTYSAFGERGSIDVLGIQPATRSIVVVEVKTDIASSEAIGRKVDEKARLAPGIVAARHGWTAANVGRIVVMPESMRLRRLVERHPIIGRMFPVDAPSIRRWLRRPTGQLAGLWFLSDTRPETARDVRAGAARRVRPRPSMGRRGTSVAER